MEPGLNQNTLWNTKMTKMIIILKWTKMHLLVLSLKSIIRSYEIGEVVSINGVHEHFDKDVKPAEAIIKNAVKELIRSLG